MAVILPSVSKRRASLVDRKTGEFDVAEGLAEPRSLSSLASIRPVITILRSAARFPETAAYRFGRCGDVFGRLGHCLRPVIRLRDHVELWRDWRIADSP